MITPEDFAQTGSISDKFMIGQNPQDPVKGTQAQAPQLSIGTPVQGIQQPLPPYQEPTQPKQQISDLREIEHQIFLAEKRQDEAVRNLSDSRNIDPQDFVNASKMAKSLGIGVDEVFKDVDLASKLYREQQFRNSQIWSSAPELAKLLEDRDFAVRAQQSIDQYSYLERTMLAWEQGGLTVRRGELGLKALNNSLTSDEKAEYDAISNRMSYLPAPSGEILPEAARMFGMQAEMLPETGGAGLAGALVGGAIGSFAGGAGAIPGAVKGYYWTSSAASAVKMYEIEAGNAYMDMIELGIDPSTASSQSKIIGVVNSAIELGLSVVAGAGFRRLVNNGIVRKFAGDAAADDVAKSLLLGKGSKNAFAQGAFDYGKALVAEPTEEYLQDKMLEYGTYAAQLASSPEYRAAMHGMGNIEEQSRAADTFANAFWGMIVGGAFQGVSGYYATSLHSSSVAQQAKSNGESIASIADIASKVQADPSTTRKLVTRLTDKHGNGDLSISSEDLLKVLDTMAGKASEGRSTPVTREDMLKVLRSADPEMAQQLDDIVASGNSGEVFVKTSDFVAKYVNNPTSGFYRSLIEHVRVIKGDVSVPLSLAESKSLLERIDELRKKEREIFDRQEKPFKEAADNVRKQLTDIFAANTRMSKSEQAVAVDLLWRMSIRNAIQYNTDPVLEFAGMPLQVAQVGKGMTNEEFVNMVKSPETLKVFAGQFAETIDRSKLKKAVSIFETFFPSEMAEMNSRINANMSEWKALEEKKQNIFINNGSVYDAAIEDINNKQSDLGRELAPLYKKFLAAMKDFKITAEQNESIRKETGWFLGSDLKWRFEISDEDMLDGMDYGVRLKASYGGTHKNEPYANFGLIGNVKLSDLIDDPELFAAYPDIGKITVSTADTGNATAWISSSGIQFNKNGSLSKGDFLSVLMHEIQHQIQLREGFDGGSNIEHAGSFEKYWNTPGEIEAREVQGRRVLTKSERSAKPVLATQQGPGVLRASVPTSAGLEATAGYIVALNKIILRKDAKFREVAHEIGHMVFEDIIYRSELSIQNWANQSEYSKEDIEIASDILTWLGVTGGSAQIQIDNWKALDAETKVRLHERVAYSYEDYLRTHSAPTKSLRSLFQKMSAILRAFWRDVKDTAASIYKKAFGEDLPVLSSPAARALDLKISLAHEIERNDIIVALSSVGMTREEAMEAGLTEQEWDELRRMKYDAVEESIDFAVSKQMGNAKWYTRAIRSALDKYMMFVNKERRKMFDEERAKLRKEGVHNLRGWTENGTAYDADGNAQSNVFDGFPNKLNAAEVLDAHKKLEEGLSYEIAQVQARLKGLDEANDAAEIAKLEEYVRLAKIALKAGTTPVLATANKIFTLGRNSFSESEKTIDQFRKELMEGFVETSLRTVRRSPLYVFRNIRSLIRAADDGKLSAQEVEDILFQIISDGSELNGFQPDARIIYGAARNAERELRLAFAQTSKDLLDAFRIEFTLEAMEEDRRDRRRVLEEKIEKAEKRLEELKATHGEQPKKVSGAKERGIAKVEKDIKKLEKQLTRDRAEWDRITDEVMADSAKPKSKRRRKSTDIPNLPAQIAGKIDRLEELRDEYDRITQATPVFGPSHKRAYEEIIAAQDELRNLLATEVKARLSKETIRRIEVDAVEQVEVNFPEFTGKLTKAEVNASVRDGVNRRIAKHIMSMFFDGITSSSGVSVTDYQKNNAPRTKNAKGFILAIVTAKQKGNDEEAIARERAEARINNEFGKIATRMHVQAGAKDLIKQAVEDESIQNAYGEYIADDGVPIDMVSTTFGYESTDSMLMDLLTAPDIDDVALDKTDERIAKIPELSDRKKIDEIVGASLSRDMRIDVLSTEIKAIQKAMQRVFEAGLTEDERTKRKEARDDAQVRLDQAREKRDDLKKKRDAFNQSGDQATADQLDAQIGALNKEIRKLSVKANNHLVTAKEVRAGAEMLAESRINRKLVRQIKPTLFLTATRRAAQNAMSAMKKAGTKNGKEDYLHEYIEAKTDEMVNEIMWRKSMAAKQKMRDNDALVDRIFGDKNDIARVRDVNFVLAARAIAVIYGLRKGNVDEAVKMVDGIKEVDPDVHAHLANVVSSALFDASDASISALKSRIVRVAEDRADVTEMPPIYEDLTWEQYSALMVSLKNLWDSAKAIKEANDAVSDMLLEVQKSEAIQSVSAINAKWLRLAGKIPYVGKWFAPRGVDSSDPSRSVSVILDFLSKNRKVESLLLELDGNKPGILTKLIWRPISNKSDLYHLRTAEFYGKYLQIIDPIKDKLNEVRQIVAEGLKDEDGNDWVFGKDGGRGLGELFWFISHIGNLSNKKNFLVRMGWGTIADGVLDDSKWETFFDKAKTDGIITDELLEAMQKIGDLFEELRPEYKKAYQKAKNIPFTDVEPMQVKGKDKTFRGWYMPAELDPKSRDKRVSEMDMEEALRVMLDEGAGRNAPFISDARGRDRVENYTRDKMRLRTDHLFIPSAFEQMLRFIYLYEPVKKAFAIINDPEVSGVINQYSHGVIKNTMIPWLKDVATRSSSKSHGDLAQAMSSLRTAVVGTQMFFNPKVAIENITGLSVALMEVDAKFLASAIVKISSSPNDTKQEIDSLSNFMKVYHKDAMMELAMEISNFINGGGKISNLQAWYKRNSTLLVKQSQMVISNVVWMGKYNQVLAQWVGNPVDAQEEAVQQADSAVRLTQNSFRVEDKSVFERGTEMVKFGFTYTGWFNMLRQLFSRKVKSAWLEETMGAATARTGWYFITAFTLPSIISASIAAFIYDKLDDDDEEKRDELINELVWLGQMRTVASGFPVIGNIAMAAIDKAMGKTFMQSAGSNPIIGGLSRQADALAKFVSMPASDKDWTGKDTRALADAISQTLGIPPIGRPTGYTQAVVSGETKPDGIVDFVRGLLTGAYQK